MIDGETLDDEGVSIEHDPTMAWEPSPPDTDEEGSKSRLEGAFAWALTVENGPQSGLTYVLGPGNTVAGRGGGVAIFLSFLFAVIVLGVNIFSIIVFNKPVINIPIIDLGGIYTHVVEVPIDDPIRHNNGYVEPELLPGFEFSLFSDEVRGVKFITSDGFGTILASVPDKGVIYAFKDIDKNGKAKNVQIVLEGLDNVGGMFVHCKNYLCHLYIAEQFEIAFCRCLVKSLIAS